MSDEHDAQAAQSLKPDYASPTTDHAVSYRRAADGQTAMMIVPAPRGRRVDAALAFAFGPWGEIWIYIAPGCAFAVYLGYWWVCPMASALFAAVIGIGLMHHRRLSGPIVVEATDQAIVFQNLSRETPLLTLPRELVYEVKYVPHSRHLVIRTRGREIFEWRPVENDAELLRMVAFLREAVGLDRAGRPASTPSSSKPS